MTRISNKRDLTGVLFGSAFRFIPQKRLSIILIHFGERK